MHDDTDKGHLLLLYSLRHQVVLEQVRIVNVGADVASFRLLTLQPLLTLAGARRK